MKKYAALLLFFFAVAVLPAQTDTVPSKAKVAIGHEIGIETNNLISRFLDEDNEGGLLESPYLLTYKLVMGQWAIRTGIGGDRHKSTETEEGFADSKTTEFNQLDYRLGIEKRFSLGKKWQANIGLDGLGFTSKNKVVEDSGFDVITTSESVNGWGAGPSFGLQFNLGKSISLYTEGSFYYTFSTLQGARLFKNFPEFDDELKETKEENLDIRLPAVLYIVFGF